jgi:oxidoreductase
LKGSNKNSPFLYIQSKGQTEQDLIDTGFKRVSIFRPRFLTLEEERQGSGPRLAESIFGKLVGATRALGLHLDVPVGVVGRSMLYAAAQPADASATSDKTSTKYFENDEIEKTGSAKL